MSTDEALRFDVVVAGGGLAGLACAAALARRGRRVAVCEATSVLGGRASSQPDAQTGQAVDIGPHVLTTEHRNLLQLLQQLGTQDLVLWQRQPLITLLDAGRALRMARSRWPAPLHGLPNLPQALRCVSLGDLLSNARLGWQAARLDEPATLALDDRDALSHLRALGVSRRMIDWFWRSAMLALLNVPLEQCSAAALMRVARLLMGRSGAHFGLPRAGLSELYVPGCVQAVKAAGGAVLMQAAVRTLRVRAGRFAGVGLADGRELQADAGVLAVPPPALAELSLCEAGRPAAAADEALGLREAVQRLRPVPYVSTHLWFDRPLTRERFWARVWKPSDLNTDFYDLSQIRPGASGGPAWFAVNAIDAGPALDWPDARLIEHTVREIADFAPEVTQARLRHARVHRIPMAVLAPAPGTERLRPQAGTRVPGLWLAGDWTATALPCSMESAARSGLLAAERVLQAAGERASLALPPPETGGLMALLRRRRHGDPAAAPAQAR